VADTGHGMTPEVRTRAFEPFFTTKGAGKGSGLGLATIYGFARQSGGNVTVYSEIGKGTTVNIYLPRAGKRDDGGATGAVPAVDAGKGETVLVVEDDERVRRLTVLRLRELGYRVLEAGDGPSALAVLAETAGIDIVLSDVVMPGGLSGFDLARQVRQHYPRTRIVLTSGYSAELLNRVDPTEPGLNVLRKPYRQAELARTLRVVLDQHGSD
jgi:CheY-like chemotaxis protein